MAELCRERVPTGRFRAHDLADPLDWLPDKSVDLGLFALALEYVDDRTERAAGALARATALAGRWFYRGSIPPVTGCVMAGTTSRCG